MARSDYEVTPEQIDMIAKDLLFSEIEERIESALKYPNEDEGYGEICPSDIVNEAQNSGRDCDFGAYDLVKKRMDEIVDYSHVCDMLDECKEAGVFTVYTVEEWKTKINEVKWE